MALDWQHSRGLSRFRVRALARMSGWVPRLEGIRITGPLVEGQGAGISETLQLLKIPAPRLSVASQPDLR